MGIESTYVKYAPVMRGYLIRRGIPSAMAEDILHDTFLKLARIQFLPQGNGNQVRHLVFKVLDTSKIDFIRKKLREQRLLTSYASTQEFGCWRPDLTEDVNLTPGSAELPRRIKAALKNISTPFLEILLLSETDASGVDIAQLQGASRSDARYQRIKAFQAFHDLFYLKVKTQEGESEECASESDKLIILKTLMMLAAVDQHVAQSELDAFRSEALRIGEHGCTVRRGREWRTIVKTACQIRLLSLLLPTDELVDEFAREAKDFIALLSSVSLEDARFVFGMLIRMARADKVVMNVERRCIRMLADRVAGIVRSRIASQFAASCPPDAASLDGLVFTELRNPRRSAAANP